MEYRIRLAKESDIPLLPGIEQRASELFASTPFAVEAAASCLSEEFHREQVRMRMTWVAADADDTPVAFAAVILVDGGPHLHELSVDPAYGRRGLGRRLVEAVCEWATAAGHHSLTLSTYRDVPWNAPFYERMGFRVMGETELSPELADLRSQEAVDGLDISQRVIMLREIVPQSQKIVDFSPVAGV